MYKDFFLKSLLELQKPFRRSILEVTFYSRKRRFEKESYYYSSLTIKSNFSLSYPKKNHSLKLTFNIFKSNKNYFLKYFLSKIII